MFSEYVFRLYRFYFEWRRTLCFRLRPFYLVFAVLFPAFFFLFVPFEVSVQPYHLRHIFIIIFLRRPSPFFDSWTSESIGEYRPRHYDNESYETNNGGIQVRLVVVKLGNGWYCKKVTGKAFTLAGRLKKLRIGDNEYVGKAEKRIVRKVNKRKHIALGLSVKTWSKGTGLRISDRRSASYSSRLTGQYWRQVRSNAW